jgi:cell division protein FtsL
MERQVSMTVANLKIGGRSFVVVPEREFARMRKENEKYRRLLSEDAALGKLAEKELKAFRKSAGHPQSSPRAAKAAS